MTGSGGAVTTGAVEVLTIADALVSTIAGGLVSTEALPEVSSGGCSRLQPCMSSASIRGTTLMASTVKTATFRRERLLTFWSTSGLCGTLGLGLFIVLARVASFH